jgi:uncharacterized protein YaaR (DUF327 family)
MERKNINTTLNVGLYKKIKVLAAKLDKHTNDVLEEAMRDILKKYGEEE